MKRREFINTALAGGVLALTGSRFTAQEARLADARIEVLLDEPIGKIAPEIYGHFVEHLGGVVYDGVWVGPDSKRPAAPAASATRNHAATTNRRMIASPP